MKYFAMIDGERKGPYTLRELIDAGVRPDTYVWSKEMLDWQEARYVAEICRAFRQRLAGVAYNDTESDSPVFHREENKPEPVTYNNDLPLSFRRYLNEESEGLEKLPDPEMLMQRPPRMLLAAAILVTLFCFPPTGILAVFYAVKGRRMWRESEKEGSVQGEKIANEARALVTMSKMFTGISFFLGMILYSFLFYKML